MLVQQILSKFAGSIANHATSSLRIQPVRWARRTCKKAKFHVERNVSPFWFKKELTSENQAYLEDLHVDLQAQLKPCGESPLLNNKMTEQKWNTNEIRTGVIAVKIGVLPQWTKEGKRFYCTLLQIIDNHVIRNEFPCKLQKRSQPYGKVYGDLGRVVVGAMCTTTQKFTKEYCGLFNEAGVLPKRKLTRFFVTKNSILEPGTPLDVSHFKVGNYIDAQAKTIDHGFQGVVTRHGFKGGPASHGNTKWHRRPGNIGGGRGKAKVFKGKKMPGHMGMEWRTTRGLKIWRINNKYNVLYVHGQGIPGPTHGYVRIYDTHVDEKRKAMLANPPPMPTSSTLGTPQDTPDEYFDDELLCLSEKFANEVAVK